MDWSTGTVSIPLTVTMRVLEIVDCAGCRAFWEMEFDTESSADMTPHNVSKLILKDVY